MRAAAEIGRGNAHSAAEGGGEVAVGGEPEVQRDSGQITIRIEQEVETPGEPSAQPELTYGDPGHRPEQPSEVKWGSARAAG